MFKRGIALISALSLLIMVGCTTEGNKANNKNRANDNIYGVDDNYVVDDDYRGLTRDSAYEYDNLRDGTDMARDRVRNDDNLYRNNYNRNNTKTRNNGLMNNDIMDWDIVERIEDICEDKNLVDDASVAINENTCYVGLDLENDGKIPERLKEELSSEIKRQNPEITKVYFTEDKGAVENFLDSIKDAVDVDWNRLEDIFR